MRRRSFPDVKNFGKEVWFQNVKEVWFQNVNKFWGGSLGLKMKNV